MMLKAQIRCAMRLRRRELNKSQQEEAAKAVFEHLAGLDAYRSAGCVMAYMACGGELSLAHVIGDILASGKALALPRCEAPGRMTARRVTDLAQLVPGAYGLKEPGADCAVVPPEEIQVILVPGTAFDVTGSRIGQGGGYYDRFLPETGALRVGVCHDFALSERIPADEHDCRMDRIVTPSGITDCHAERTRKTQEESK